MSDIFCNPIKLASCDGVDCNISIYQFIYFATKKKVSTPPTNLIKVEEIIFYCTLKPKYFIIIWLWQTSLDIFIGIYNIYSSKVTNELCDDVRRFVVRD